MRHPLSIILIAGCLIGGTGHAGTAFDLVNQHRAEAGLPPLGHDEALARAAQRHAHYLDRHREPGESGQGLSAHVQRPGMEGFSGESPAARALEAGYPHRQVLENVSMGYADAGEAIEGLMSAIYHRLTFLDLAADRLGVAEGERARVFMLGRDDIGELCESPPAGALYRTPVDCLGQAMTRDHYEAMCTGLPPQALFRASHPVACPNGRKLDAAFMAGVCDRPPAAARFRGHGRYYEPCENGSRIDAHWFNGLCEDPPEAAAYTGSGSYYEICEGPLRVKAEWFEAACAALPEPARYTDSGRYRRPCADDTDIRVEYLDGLDAARLEDRPMAVLWPPRGADQVPPAFFIEDPDPLPDLDVSGYPVSIQFNPAHVARVELKRFGLARIDGPAPVAVAPLRVLDQDSDPHGLLTAHQFVLFPLQRLAWGARYLASVEALVDGQLQYIDWEFETQGKGMPLLTVKQPRQHFVVQSGVDYLLYLPPTPERHYTVLSSRTEHLRGNRVSLEVVDPNTLQLHLDARFCERISIQFDGGETVGLTPAGCPQ